MGSVTNTLLLFIWVVYVFQLLIPVFTNEFIFDPSLAISQPWRFVTSIFLHDPTDFLHILLNSFALWMFGRVLETQVHARNYLLIFFGAGITGSIFYYSTYLIGMIPSIPALGASGAIYGIMGAVAMMLPDMRVYFFFFPLKMRDAAILWIVMEFLGTFDIASGVASAAHLGGLLFGLAAGYYLKHQYQPPVYGQEVPGTWSHA